MLIALISVFLAPGGGLLPSLILTIFILLGVAVTLLVSGLLSKTLLKGLPSSMTLEMPPFRRPQIGQILIRSFIDRTLFVLGRAVAVAAPAGLFIWLAGNVTIKGVTVLSWITGFLDPVGRFFGMDGVILTAFILGLPANETVIPIMIMAYTAGSSITGYENLASLRVLLVSQGWTWVTALCVILFSLMHWPCSTTISTIKKETGSLKLTAAAILIPTFCGFAACAAVYHLSRLFL